MEQSISIYQNLQEVSALIFHDVKFTGNIFLLDKDYSESKNYEGDDIIKLNEVWLKLYDDYFAKTDDPRFRKELKNKKQSFQLLCAITKGKEFLDLLQFVSDNELFMPNECHEEVVTTLGNGLKQLAKEYRFDEETSLNELIEHNRRVLGGLQTRYERTFRTEGEVEERDISLFYDIKGQIERILNKDYIPEHINMLQWISYEKQYKKEVSRLSKQK